MKRKIEPKIIIVNNKNKKICLVLLPIGLSRVFRKSSLKSKNDTPREKGGVYRVSARGAAWGRRPVVEREGRAGSAWIALHYE